MGKRASQSQPPPAPAPPARQVAPEWVATVLLVALTLAAFLPACGNGFVEYDDQLYVTENPRVQSGLSSGLGWAITDTSISAWHPLAWWSLQLDAQLYGHDATGFHFTNVVFHTLSVVLLFWALRTMTDALVPSAIVAALFAVHPLRVEAVVWVSQRKDTLATLFWMLTLLAYAWYVRKPSVRRYLLVAAPLTVGLLAKPTLVTLPCVLLLLDYWPLNRLTRATALRLVLEKLPLFAVVVAGCVVTVVAQHRVLGTAEQYSSPMRLANALLAYAQYLGNFFWPFDLAAFYPHPRLGLGSWKVLTAAAALVVVTVLVVREAKRRPYLLVGWLWFLGTFVPMIGLVQIAGHGRADRYTYLPHIGLTLAVVWLLVEVAERYASWQTPLRVALGVVVGGFVLVTWKQSAIWQSAETLCTHALEVTTGNHEAHRNLAVMRERDEKFPEAQKHFEAALACHPDKRVVHNDLGALFMKQRRYDEATQHFLKSLELDPYQAETRNNLGTLYLMQGKPDEAVTHLDEAMKLNPSYAGTHFNLALARAMQGRFDESAAHFATGQQFDGTNPLAYHSYGVALRNNRRPDLAIPQIEAALRLRPETAEFHSDLGLALRFAQQVPRAVEAFREAVRLNPRDARHHRYLAHALTESGDPTTAAVYYQNSLELDRRWPEALDQQAWRLAGYPDAAMRNGPVAVHLAEQVCQATGFREAGYVDTLAAAYAEVGRFDEAANLARKAVELALAARQNDMAAEMRDRLRLYEAKQPFRGRVERSPQ